MMDPPAEGEERRATGYQRAVVGVEFLYRAHTVYNAMIDRHPRVVVRCSQAGDIAAAVDFARENELAVAGDEIPSWKPIGREGMVIGSQEIDRRGTRQDLTKLTLIRCNAVSHLSVGVEG